MRLTVVIVNYNVRYFLEQCLISTKAALQGIESEIFVVDNNSVDDSLEMLRDKFPEVQLIANKENVGFSVANNQAIKKAKGEYILLLNPDTVVQEDTFSVCLSFMDRHPNAGGAGVMMIDGSGNFLPESKRGFPSPRVAFYKAFGFSKLFSKSKIFNWYHLGHLDKNENHKIDVIAGAFMLMRKSVLDKVGLLDEAFFMYGEDIDLSYRISQAGYDNYYISDTKIIHYKGESTKKGSLNYVRTFYKAMIIFAKKHFSGEKAWSYVLLINMAIYFRGLLTLVRNFFKRYALLLCDAGILFGGLVGLKHFWASWYHNNPAHFSDSLTDVNFPGYILVWILAVFFFGGYDRKYEVSRSIKGILFGSLILAAVYGFVPDIYRHSRALLLIGSVWAVFGLVLTRSIFHWFEYGNLIPGSKRIPKLLIVGSSKESDRVLGLMKNVGRPFSFIGRASDEENDRERIGTIDQLDELVRVYKGDEIVFCSANISAQQITTWMSKLGPDISYRIAPENMQSIIGSTSKNAPGDLYTIEIKYNIAQPEYARLKRGVDLFVALFMFILSPLLIWFQQSPMNYLSNVLNLIIGKKTLVAYKNSPTNARSLPELGQGVLTPLDELGKVEGELALANQLNINYARHYTPMDDFRILFKSLHKLGRA